MKITDFADHSLDHMPHVSGAHACGVSKRVSLAVSLSRDLLRIDLETVHVDAQQMVYQNVSKVVLICCQSIFGFDLCPGMVLRVSNCRSPDIQDFRVLPCFHRCDRISPRITCRASCRSSDQADWTIAKRTVQSTRALMEKVACIGAA